MTHVAAYVALADHGERVLADAFDDVAEAHAHLADVFHLCHQLAGMSRAHRIALAAAVDRYGEERVDEPEQLRHVVLGSGRSGQLGLVRDLQALYLLATRVQTTWTVLGQAAQALRDRELLDVVTTSNAETSRQLTWLLTRMKEAAPQALVVAP